MSFRLVPKSVTLNGVMAVILRYFSEFGYLPGVLRKSSCSLCHLLMSSCYIMKLCSGFSSFTVKIVQKTTNLGNLSPFEEVRGG